MLFEVSRTSVSDPDVKPCEESSRLRINDLDSVWVIDIENLAQLMDFQGNYGYIIIRDGQIGCHLEIYDDNRE